LQIELGTLKTLSGILHENNRQRMDLFGLAAKKHDEGFDWSIDYIEAAREGGLDVKDPTPTDRPAEEPARVDHRPDTVPASGDFPK